MQTLAGADRSKVVNFHPKIAYHMKKKKNEKAADGDILKYLNESV